MSLPNNPSALVADPGRVRLGAGMRRTAARADRAAATPAPRPARPVVAPGVGHAVATLVADPGRVRLGAGMRRQAGRGLAASA